MATGMLAAGPLAGLLPMIPVSAAGATIAGYGTDTNCPPMACYWAPSSTTINSGDSLSWSSSSGTHGLQKESGPWPASCANNTSSPCTFSNTTGSPITFSYQCFYHGPNMKGSFTVNPAAAPPPQTTNPAPKQSQPAPKQSQAQTGPSAAASASPTDTPAVALASPSASPTGSPSPAGGSPLATNPANSSSGGSPLIPIVVVVVVLASGAGAFWYFRLRPGRSTG